MATAFRTLARAALCAVTLCSFARADVPRTIALQGTLKDAAGTPLTGPHQVTFSLYDSATEGTPLWTETQTVTPTNGLFAVPLGSVTPLNLPFDKPYWVGIKVGDDAEMSPRVPLNSAPYAISVPDNSIGATKLSSNPASLLQVSGGFLSSRVNTPGVGDALISGGFRFRNDVPTSPVTVLDIYTPPSPSTGKFERFTWYANEDAGWVTPRALTLWQYPSDNQEGCCHPIAGFGLDANGVSLQQVFGNLWVNPQYQFGPTTRLNLPVGDNDTGLNWGGDGVLDFYANDVSVMQLTSGGLSLNRPLLAPTLTLTSSRRFKRDVQPLTNVLGTLSQLQGVSYVWDEQHGGKPDIGFIAEDAGKVVPELVTWEPNGVDAVGMDYSHLTALTVEGIKEQQKEIAAQTQRITALETENADLKARLERLEALVAGGGPR